MSGEVGLMDAQLVLHLSNRQLLFSQRAGNKQPVWMGQGFEKFCDMQKVRGVLSMALISYYL